MERSTIHTAGAHECHTDDVDEKRRRWLGSPLGWGWLAFSVGAAVAGGAFLAYVVVLYSAGCRRPSTGWGSTRTSFCDDFLGRFIWPSLPWVVVVSLGISVLAGLVGGAVAAARLERRMPGVWLASTALMYGGCFGVLALAPNGGDVAPDVAFSVLPLTALVSTGLLAVWVGITGGLWAVVCAMRSRPRKRPEREGDIDIPAAAP